MSAKIVKIFFPPGNYVLPGPIKIDGDNIEIEGVPGKTVFIQAKDKDCSFFEFADGAVNVSIKGLTLIF